MKKYERREKEVEGDEKVESRFGLKDKLREINSGDFDLSKFSESINEPSMSRINQPRFQFPLCNEPTLEDSQPGDNLKMDQDSGLQQYYGQGVTARNSYQKSKSGNSYTIQLELNIDDLSSKLELKEAEVLKYKNTSEHLQAEVLRLRKEVQVKEKTIDRQTNEIEELRFKQLVSSEYSSKQSSSRTSLSETVNDFCPQMLSPEQTELLLSQLLKKASKSVRLLKLMSEDPCMKQILTKVSKR